MSPELQNAFDNILDCFGGADGGIAFIKLKVMLEDFDKQSQEHTPEGNTAFQVLRVVHQFNRLIELAGDDGTAKTAGEDTEQG